MTEFRLISLSGCSQLWTLNPSWPLHQGGRVRRDGLRDRQGGLFTVHWGGWYEATLPVEFVAQPQRDALQGWWRYQQRLAWTVDGSDGPRTAVVRIANPLEPVGRRETAHAGRYRGSVRLAGIGEGSDTVRGAPLILDHPRFGTLDTHHLLL